MRTLLALAFIAAAAAGGIYVARRPTIARGDVLAADLLDQFRARGWRELKCDDQIPIGLAGAKFYCRLKVVDGDTALLAITMDREGQMKIDIAQQSAPEHSHAPASADPWD